jgi:hypothetical protein
MACNRGSAGYSRDDCGGCLSAYGNRFCWSHYRRWQRQHFIGSKRRVRYRSIAYIRPRMKRLGLATCLTFSEKCLNCTSPFRPDPVVDWSSPLGCFNRERARDMILPPAIQSWVIPCLTCGCVYKPFDAVIPSPKTSCRSRTRGARSSKLRYQLESPTGQEWVSREDSFDRG